MAVIYRSCKDLESISIRDLFLSVNWPIGNKSDRLQQAFRHSDKVFTAWDNEKLVGLINSISDSSLTAYIPYLLVNPNYQKKGIGKKLVSTVISEYESYERIVLLTEKDAVNFYIRCGFIENPSIHVMMITHQ